jgi:hypothetical protein
MLSRHLAGAFGMHGQIGRISLDIPLAGKHMAYCPPPTRQANGAGGVRSSPV